MIFDEIGFLYVTLCKVFNLTKDFQGVRLSKLKLS